MIRIFNILFDLIASHREGSSVWNNISSLINAPASGEFLGHSLSKTANNIWLLVKNNFESFGYLMVASDTANTGKLMIFI